MQEVMSSNLIISTKPPKWAAFLFMDYHVYILYSKSLDRYYVGSSGDINDRLSRHNAGCSKSTKAGIPWELTYTQAFETRAMAVQRELYIKSRKSRKYIIELIANQEEDQQDQE